jgi:hypothetical protein
MVANCDLSDRTSLARHLDVTRAGRSVPADTVLVVARHRALLLSAITAAIRTEKREIDFDPALLLCTSEDSTDKNQIPLVN